MAASLKSQQKEKEMAAMVDGVYKFVMEDVINGVRADFQSEDVDEGVLHDLQSIWMMKLLQHPGALVSSTMNEPWQANKVDPPTVGQATTKTDTTSTTSNTRIGSPPVRDLTDLNVAYTPIDEYETHTPTVEMLFPATPLQEIDDEPVMKDFLSSGSSEVSFYENGQENGRRAPYLKPPTWLQSPKPIVDMNVEYQEGEEEEQDIAHQEAFPKDFFTLSTGKRKREELASPGYFAGKYISQQDGSGELALASPSSATVAPRNQEETGRWNAERSAGRGPDPWSWQQTSAHADSQIAELLSTKRSRQSLDIPQLDGNEDTYDEVAEENYNEPDEEEVVPVEAESKAEGEAGTESDGSEPPLNDADDDPDEDDQGSEELKAEHLVLAQFEKVSRTRNKWKCVLKDGIMHLNTRDLLFNKANGEFEF